MRLPFRHRRIRVRGRKESNLHFPVPLESLFSPERRWCPTERPNTLHQQLRKSWASVRHDAGWTKTWRPRSPARRRELRENTARVNRDFIKSGTASRNRRSQIRCDGIGDPPPDPYADLSDLD